MQVIHGYKLTISLTAGISFLTSYGDTPGSILEDAGPEGMPEFRIETATDKLRVNLTDNYIVSLTPRVNRSTEIKNYLSLSLWF